MTSDTRITAELTEASRAAIAARRALEQLTPLDPEYKDALVEYLRTTVRHLGIVAVAQNLQYEALAAEIDELREDMVRARQH